MLRVVVVVAAAVVAIAPTAGARPSRVILGKIAVVEKAADAYDTESAILVLNGDGSARRTVTRGLRASNLAPTWSPDGRMLAFNSGDVYPATSALVVMNADGTERRRLTRYQRGYGGSLRGWSRDSRWVIWADNRKRGEWLVAVDGTGRRKAMPHGGGTYSPDGGWIARTRQNGAMYLISVASGTERRVARPAVEHGSAYAAWAPNSRLLLVTRPGGAAYIVSVDGTKRATAAGDGAWSPDSRWIAFSAYGTNAREECLYVIPASGGRPKRITHGHFDSQPTWSPDGARIAFIRGGQLWIANRDGSDAWRVVGTRLSPTSGEHTFLTSPTWSPR